MMNTAGVLMVCSTLREAAMPSALVSSSQVNLRSTRLSGGHRAWAFKRSGAPASCLYAAGFTWLLSCKLHCLCLIPIWDPGADARVTVSDVSAHLLCCRFGSVLENVEVNELTREVDYMSNAITENTRASYPIDYIDNAKIPCVGPQPRNVVLLCCDAFGVLPPVSRLSLEQVMYHFISGYTSKVCATVPRHQAGCPYRCVTSSAVMASRYLPVCACPSSQDC